MAQTYPEMIWHNGAIKRWHEATTHVMAHAIHYGSSAFAIKEHLSPGEKVHLQYTTTSPLLHRRLHVEPDLSGLDDVA